MNFTTAKASKHALTHAVDRLKDFEANAAIERILRSIEVVCQTFHFALVLAVEQIAYHVKTVISVCLYQSHEMFTSVSCLRMFAEVNTSSLEGFSHAVNRTLCLCFRFQRGSVMRLS